MADGLNKAILIGNLGRDPELRYTQKGRAVLRLRLATSESYLDREGERQERTDWHTVTVWGRRAEGLNRVLGKGGRIGIEGRIRHRSWEDPEGKKRTSTEVEALEVVLLDAPRAGHGMAAEAPDGAAAGPGAGGAVADADIPF